MSPSVTEESSVLTEDSSDLSVEVNNFETEIPKEVGTKKEFLEEAGYNSDRHSLYRVDHCSGCGTHEIEKISNGDMKFYSGDGFVVIPKEDGESS